MTAMVVRWRYLLSVAANETENQMQGESGEAARVLTTKLFRVGLKTLKQSLAVPDHTLLESETTAPPPVRPSVRHKPAPCCEITHRQSAAWLGL